MREETTIPGWVVRKNPKENMVIEFLAHCGHGPFSDEGLEIVDGQFQAAGRGDGNEVNGAVQDQTIDIAQGDRVVDDSFLHFEGDNPGKDDQYNDHHQDNL
jgi:hypothetical protein